MPSEKGTAVIGVGGNSLILNANKQGIHDQAQAAEITVHHIGDMIEDGWNVVLTHGSGPQVGFILRRSELARDEVAMVPMDYADADIQGAVGYMFQRALHNEFKHRGLDRKAVTLVTQVLVDQDDEAFRHPTKPIGPQMDQKTAEARAEEMGWTVADDAGRGWRRLVPSPEPKKIIELEQIKILANAGVTVIACGGGGIPVWEDVYGNLDGVEAVVDKDLASSLLARAIGADLLLLSTGVEKVAVDFKTPNQRWLDRLDLAEAKALYEADQFDAGSMGPKVRAMIEYLEAGGKLGIITDPEHMQESVSGTAGTRFVPN
ncbi:MAG: carbamate kinase [Proteobacteria bacterium]|nr:carbamate kinase [Pseudomonadota bacterium]